MSRASDSADFSMVLMNQAKQGSKKQEGLQRHYRQCSGRTAIQGEGAEGDKDISQNNGYILSSSNLSEIESWSTFVK